MTPTAAPDRTEAAEYYFTYINQVPAGDIVRILEAQLPETVTFLRTIPDDRSMHRYAPDKWTIRQVLSHMNDGERVFAYRALWFARGFDSELPSFDQNVAIESDGAHERTWPALIDEFQAVRQASLALFRDLPPKAWTRRGVASGNPFTVRALAYIIAGHVFHHVKMLRERYV